MLLRYRQIQHLIEFEKPVIFPTLPTFLFRSILGKELRRLVCIFRGRPCGECGLKFTCAYSWMFETPIAKETPVLEGRDRASHPFLLATDAVVRKEVQTITLTITVMGKAIEYYPYIFYALKKAGKIGILRERTPFEIKNILCEGQSILQQADSIHPSWGIKQWSLRSEQQNTNPKNSDPLEASVMVHIDSPLRLRVNGKYTSQFTSVEFLASLYRRAVLLCSLYGSQGAESSSINGLVQVQTPPVLSESVRIVSRNLRWEDQIYYSSRQKKRLTLGGVMGDFTIKGNLKPIEQSLLTFGELFHVGKNTAFGLGRYHVEYKSG